jgi:hypothetical protein
LTSTQSGISPEAACQQGTEGTLHESASREEHLNEISIEPLFAREACLARYLHPEFGAFCPACRLRRDVRVVAFSVFIGVAAGAVGVLALSASDAPVGVGSDASSGEAAKFASAGGASGHPSDQATSTAPAGQASTEPAETTAQAYSDVGRSFFKPRKVLVRALNDGPDTGRIIVGRSDVPAAARAPETPSASPQSSPSQKTEEKNPSVAADTQQKSAAERLQHVSREPSKKRVKTARREKRQRNEWGTNDYFGRVDPWAARAENSAGTIGRSYAREASYGRRGYWGWSW